MPNLTRGRLSKLTGCNIETIRYYERVGLLPIQLLLNWQERASQRRHLGSLGDRALKDIGLSRADAAGESARPFWRS